MDPEVETPAAPETPAVDTSQPADKIPAPTPETPAVETPKGPTDVEIYQDVVARYNEDPTLQMTEKESEIYLETQEKINNKIIPEPTPKKLESKEPAPDKPDSDIPSKKEEPAATDDKETPASEPDKDKLPSGDSVADSMMEAMKQVGAKDVTELPGKIEGLIKNRDASGGQLGSENVALKAKVIQLETEKTDHVNWLNGLNRGDQAAVDYLHDKVGYKPNSSQPAPAEDQGGADDAPGDIGNVEDYLDTELAKTVNKQVSDLKKVIQEQGEKIKTLSTRDKVRDDDALTSKATNGWIDDVVKLVTSPENAKAYGLNAIEARGLAEFYFSPAQKDQPIHPKFQKVHELISFAYDKQYPTLEAAHIVNYHKSGAYAKSLVEATKNGQQNFIPSQNSENSDKQSRGNNNIPDPTVSEDDVSRMEGGSFNEIPDDWMDKQGNLIPAKVPKRFHEQAFGRAKPA